MKKKLYPGIFMVAIFILFACSARAQVNVYLFKPPPTMWHVEDLWDLTLTNTQNETLEVYLKASITSAQDGEIFYGTSAVFTLPPLYSGRVDPRSLEPADIGYANDEYKEYVRRTGKMREGTYQICVFVFDTDLDIEIGRDCYNQIIMDLSPPELISPFDESVISDPFPIFIWMPPMTLSPGFFVSYRIRIVELLDGQEPIEAMESNPAWFVEKGIRSTSFQFPISARSMMPGMRYAWQVTCENEKEKIIIGKSEVWIVNYGDDYQIRVDSLVIVGYEWDFDDGSRDKASKMDIKYEWDYDDGMFKMAKESDSIKPLKFWMVDTTGVFRIVKNNDDTLGRKPWAWDLDEGMDEIRPEVCDDGQGLGSDDDYMRVVSYEWDLGPDGKFKMIMAKRPGIKIVTFDSIDDHTDGHSPGGYNMKPIKYEWDFDGERGAIAPYEWDLDTDGMLIPDWDLDQDDTPEDSPRFALYVTNPNPGPANLYITGITKTAPKSKPPEIIAGTMPIMIKGGDQGVITGKINMKKTNIQDIWMEVILEDQLNPRLNRTVIESSNIRMRVIRMPDSRKAAPAKQSPDARHK